MRGATVLVLFLVSASPSAAQEMFLRSVRIGQGVSRARGNECIVITAGHVVEGAAQTSVTAENGARATAELVRPYGDDITLLRVEAGADFPCGPWRVPDTVDVILDRARDGYVRLRTEAGGLVQVPVAIVARNDRSLEIDPAASEQLRQTMSGSPLYVDGEMIGVLLSVRSGRGRVLRIDALEDLLRSYMDNRGPVSLRQPTQLRRAPQTFRSVDLRSESRDLSERDVSRAITRLGLFEADLNAGGRGVDNDYDLTLVPKPSFGVTARSVPGTAGALVTAVTNEPARVAGLLQGDLIVEFDGQPVASALDHRRLVQASRFGRVVTVTLIRDGTRRSFRVALGEAYDSVVVDYRTGLMWQRSGSADAYSYDAAEDYVRVLNYVAVAGHRDWRIPTTEEALSIVEPFPTVERLGGRGVYVDLEVFSRSPWSIWTSDNCGGRGTGWALSFDRGDLFCVLRSTLKHVRAVR